MPSKVYIAPETAITFKSTGGTVTFTPTSVANGAGRISDQHDRGSGSKPGRYRWRARTKFASALTVGNLMQIYLATSDGTYVDGNLGTSDAGLSAVDKLRNLRPVGNVEADSTSSGEVQIASGIVWIYERYVSVVWWNAALIALSATAGDHEFTLEPIPDEAQ